MGMFIGADAIRRQPWLLATLALAACGSTQWYFEHIPIEAAFNEDGTCSVTIRGISLGDGLRTERGAGFRHSALWTCKGQASGFGGGSFLASVVLPSKAEPAAQQARYVIGNKDPAARIADTTTATIAEWLDDSNQASVTLMGLPALADSDVYVAGVSGDLTVTLMDSTHFVARIKMVGQRRNGLD